MASPHPGVRADVALVVATLSMALVSPLAAQKPEVSPAPAAAVTPHVFYACYVPTAGVTYRIKEDGLRTQCLAGHVEFTWTDGEQAVRSADPAGGDLSGTYPNPSVVKLQGSPVSNTAPTENQVLTWNGTAWMPSTPAAGASGTAENAPNTLVQRDASGGFAAGMVTATAFQGNGSGLTGLDAANLSTGVLDVARLPSVVEFGRLSVSGTSSLQGATSLAGLAHVNTDGGLVVSGALLVGAIPFTGPGIRLMWYPAKVAFRAGEAEGTEWDDPNVGFHSVATGRGTTASGATSTAMGNYTTASGDRSTAMGNHTTASGDLSTAMGAVTAASGFASTAMGSNTVAFGAGSTAMGSFAMANQVGSFVYGDGSSTGHVSDLVPNSFVVRASGGTIFYSNSDLSAGVWLAPGAGAWASVSDVNRKENFREVDAEAVLGEIARMPIREWNYKAQNPSVRHLGPTAQDFWAAFGVGESDTTITTTDIDGVNLLAIQALERRTREQAREIEALRAEIAELRAAISPQKQ